MNVFQSLKGMEIRLAESSQRAFGKNACKSSGGGKLKWNCTIRWETVLGLPTSLKELENTFYRMSKASLNVRIREN